MIVVAAAAPAGGVAVVVGLLLRFDVSVLVLHQSFDAETVTAVASGSVPDIR